MDLLFKEDYIITMVLSQGFLAYGGGEEKSSR